MMEKPEALSILFKCSQIYKQELEPFNYLFVFGTPQALEYIQVMFPPQNFHHLTGIYCPELTSTQFYRACVDQRLSLAEFEFYDKTTIMKLTVLPFLLRITKSAKMIGQYAGHQLILSTDTLIGGTSACMGFVKEDNYKNCQFSVPNTALHEDIRNITTAPQKQILFIFRKERKALKYNRLTMMKRSLSMDEKIFPNSIRDKIDFKNLTREF